MIVVRRALLPVLALAWLAGALRAQTAPAAAARGSYTGPGSCAAASCHGSVRPAEGSRIPQTEYGTWLLQDKHAKATEALGSPQSLRMAKQLGLQRADAEPKCLACHAVDAPEGRRARSYTSEGVSCEACHGPASGWLGPHTTREWTHAQSVEQGMYDTKDVVKRAEQCASCHIGTAEKVVDHEMIAAGHPDLVFDLEAFSAAMPRHWQDPPADDPGRVVRNWRTGQIVLLQHALDRLARHAKGPRWPEFSELDCFACHHGLTRSDESWRQESGNQGRRPGSVPWNPARVSMVRVIARTLDATTAAQLESEVARLADEVSKPQGSRDEIAAATARLKPVLDRLRQRGTTMAVDPASTARLIRAVVDDADRIAFEGERAAEQAAMSLETLLREYTRATRGDERATRVALDRLFQQLENPSGYDPRRFAAQLKRVADLLPRT